VCMYLCVYVRESVRACERVLCVCVCVLWGSCASVCVCVYTLTKFLPFEIATWILCVCVYICVCGREKQREIVSVIRCVCVCVHVCVYIHCWSVCFLTKRCGSCVNVRLNVFVCV